ncbi:MAG: SUMF1/EgtB/PvdO family nonheme iron enzyme [Lentisphaerae bacterium]|nr:SUMF1/EgtB/PvdO family nonheme iron enzyme [Lentisphaerota bacterium]
MKCRHCQREIADKVKFCPECGASTSEEDTDALLTDFLKVKELLAEHRLSSCRTGIEALRRRINTLIDEHGAERTKQLEPVQDELKALAEAYRKAAAEYRDILTEARDKLKACSYEECLALCDSARIANSDDGASDEIASAAKAKTTEASLLLRQARQAYSAHRWKEAECACKKVLAEHPGYKEAEKLLLECRLERLSHKRVSTRIVTFAIVIIALAGGWLYGVHGRGRTHVSPSGSVDRAEESGVASKPIPEAVRSEKRSSPEALIPVSERDDQAHAADKFDDIPIQPVSTSNRPLRVPDGCRAALGTSPEPYTNTGWAAAIIHEKSGIELVYIPAGSFTMGSPASEHDAVVSPETPRAMLDGEVPQHQVLISAGYYLGKYEVTQGQWEKITKRFPSRFRKAGINAPVESVSWDDCQAFCTEAGSGLRLPMEAEWEYACRAGTTTALYSGDIEIVGVNNIALALDPIAWYYGNSEVSYKGQKTFFWIKGEERYWWAGTHPVGQKEPNAWGLYDMIGNVWEWCQDKFETYPAGPVTLVQPTGPAGRADEDRALRVSRGGGWDAMAAGCRSATRRASPYGFGDIGLRVALSVPTAE